MIVFELLDFPTDCNYIPCKYPEILYYDVHIKIMIDSEVFFDEPNFPIFEFLYYIKKWRKSVSESFRFISLETEDNPLISFLYTHEGWTVHSRWQYFECEKRFTKIELYKALDFLEFADNHGTVL